MVGLLLGSAPAARGQDGLVGRPNPFKASTSNESREDAIRSIPFDKIAPDAQTTVKAILSNVTIFRRMPARMVQCDPDLYLFLLDHPDVVVNVWQVLGITQISLEQIDGGGYRLTDSAGTDGTIHFLYRSHDTHLIYTEGKYEGPLSTKPTRGRGILLLKTGYVREADGRCYITTRLDSFMQVEPGGAELLTKTFQPIVGKIADLNFVQTVAFVGSLSRTAEVNSRGVQRLASRLTKVQPAVREEFAQLADRIGQRAGGYPAVAGGVEEPLVARTPDETATQ